jgi:hypothetical protein
MSRLTRIAGERPIESTETSEAERCTPDMEGCPIDLRPSGARSPQDRYETYLPVSGGMADATRFEDGVRVRGRDGSGRPFEVESARDGKEVFVQRGGQRARFVIEPQGGIAVDTGSFNRSVGSVHDLSRGEKALLHFGLAVHAQGALRRPDPREVERAAARAAEAEATAKARLEGSVEARFEAAVGRAESAHARLDRLAKGFAGRAKLEGFYHYAHVHYDRLKDRLIAADGEKVELEAGRKLATVFRARNAAIAEHKRALTDADRAANELVRLFEQPDFAALSVERRTALALRASHLVTSSEDAARRFAALVEDGKEGRGPLAHFQAALEVSTDPDKTASVSGKGAKVVESAAAEHASRVAKRLKEEALRATKESAEHGPGSAPRAAQRSDASSKPANRFAPGTQGAAILATIRTAASSVNIAGALSRLRNGGDFQRESYVIGSAVSSIASVGLGAAGMKVASKIASAASNILSGIVAAMDYRSDAPTLEKVGQGLQVAGAALSLVPGVGTVIGSGLTLLGSLLAWIGGKSWDPKTEGEMQRAGLLR